MAQNTWKNQWLANYKCETEEAKECLQYQKETYKGDPYLPWAFMERVFYMQDPNAEVEFLGIVDSSYTLETKANGNESISTIVSPMVHLKGTFLGKTLWEMFPVLDNDYSAPRAINQNMINRAIQRGKTRLISKLTGIGWRIYEKGDLQFEEVKKPTPTPTKPSVTLDPPPTKKEEPKVVTEDVDKTILDFIKSNDEDKVKKALLNYNVSLMKSYGFVLNTTDTDADLLGKISKIKNKEKFLKGLERLVTSA